MSLENKRYKFNTVNKLPQVVNPEHLTFTQPVKLMPQEDNNFMKFNKAYTNTTYQDVSQPIISDNMNTYKF